MLMPATRPCLLAWVPERDHDPLAGEAVHRLDAVARGPHAVDLGAHAVVDGDPTGRSERDPGLAGELDVRAYAETRARPGRPAACGPTRSARRRAWPSGPVSISATPSSSTSVMPIFRTASAMKRADVGIERADRRGGAVDDRDVQAAHLARLGDLEADVAAADDDDPAGTGVEGGAQGGAVVEGLHPVHAGRVDPGHRRAHRARCPWRRRGRRTARRTPGRSRGRGRARCGRPGRSP